MKLRLKRKIEDVGPLGFYRFYHARDGMTLQLHAVRLAILLGLLVIIGYIGVVGVAYTIRSNRPYNQITLADFALPWRWGKLNEKAGRTNLDHGKALFEEEDYSGALHMLRAGLRRVPEDHEARLLLAQIYQGGGKSEAATNVLGIGLNYGYPEDQSYVDTLIVLLAMREDYVSIGQISNKLRSFPEVRKDKQRWVALAELELNALKKERNFEQMLDYARDMQAIEPDNYQYLDLEILSLAKLGFIDEATAILESMPLARQHSPHYRYLEAMLAMQTGELEAMDEAIESIMRWPTYPFTLQTQLIIELHEAGFDERRDTQRKYFLNTYQENPDALVLGIRIFYEQLSVKEIDELLEQLATIDANKALGMQLYAIQARLYAGQALEAQQLFQQWAQNESVAEQMSKYQWLEHLIDVLVYKRQDDRATFWELMRKNYFPITAYLTSTQALLAGDDFETAERIAENGLFYYPHDAELARMRREAISGK